MIFVFFCEKIMSFEVDYVPGCINTANYSEITKTVISVISIVFIFVVLVVGLYVSLKSIRGLFLMKKNYQNVSGSSFVKGSFYVNILLFWLLFVSYGVSTGICSINYFMDDLSINDWIMLFGFISNVLWVFQFMLTIGINNFARLHYALVNTEFEFSSCYLFVVSLCVIASWLVVMAGVSLYYVSHFTGYQQYREYGCYLPIIGYFLSLVVTGFMIAKFIPKLKQLVRYANIESSNPFNQSTDDNSFNLQSMLTSKKKNISSNTNANDQKLPLLESFSYKQIEIIKYSAQLITLIIFGAAFSLIPVSLSSTLGFITSNDTDQLLSFIANMILILYALLAQMYTYLQFPFGYKLYYQCFKCCDMCIRRSLGYRGTETYVHTGNVISDESLYTNSINNQTHDDESITSHDDIIQVMFKK